MIDETAETPAADDQETQPEAPVSKRAQGLRNVAKTVVFLVFVAAIVFGCNVLFTPYQTGSHTKETVRGMYLQSDNSIQVAFFGASNMLSAVSPMSLYEEYGINGYNCSSSVQPYLVSYALLKDLHSHNRESLSTVVVEATMILRDTTGVNRSAWAERAIVNMQDSLVKLNTIVDFSDSYKDVKLSEELLPVLKYHARWNQLTEEDYDFFNDVSDSVYSHGEFVRYRANVENGTTEAPNAEKNEHITDELNYTTEELEAMWNKRFKESLDKLVDYCKAEGLNLVMVKTPNTNWDDKSHDSVTLLTDGYGIPFLDMSTSEIIKACGVSYAYDFVDNHHPNIRGSEKVTHYLGRYLLDTFDNWKQVDFSKFAYLQDDLAKYKLCQEDGKLLTCTNFEEYLQLISNPRYTVFVTTKGKVNSGAFSEKEKALIEQMGFTKLVHLVDGIPYVAVSDNGVVLAEKAGEDASEPMKLTGTYRDSVAKVKSAAQANIDKAYKFTLTSPKIGGGSATFTMAEEQLSENGEGINFVVYDRELHELIDTSCFGPSQQHVRTSDLLSSDAA